MRRILTEADDSDLSEGPMAVDLRLRQEPDEEEEDDEDEDDRDEDSDDAGDEDEGYSE